MISSRTQLSGGKRPYWIVAALFVMLLVLQACSTPGGEDEGPGSQQHLRLAGSTFGLSTIDPALVRDVDTAFVSRQVFRGLMRLNSSLEPVPDLAESVEVLDEGSRYRFTLHENLTFHDGKPIDAEAVVKSFNRASDPELVADSGGEPPAATYLGDVAGIDERLRGETNTISGIDLVNERTIEFTLKHPAATFLLKMAGLPTAVVDVDAISGDSWWQDPNGSGPFQVDEYVAGARLILTGFDDYAGGPPRLDRITILLGQEALQPLNLYENGAIDVASVPGWAIDRLQAESDPFHSQLVASRQMSTTYLAFNPTVRPYDLPEVRKLIAAGFDVDRYIELAIGDRAERANGMIPPGIGGRDWKSDPVPYDLDVAKNLHDQLPADLTQAMIVEPGGGTAATIAEILERDTGFELVVLDQPWPDFAARLPDRSLPAFVLTWVADYPDPENTLADLLRTGSPDNYLAYSNPEFDALVDRALLERDEDARAALYLEAQQVVLDDAIVIPLYHGMSYRLVQPWVHGLEITEIGILGLEDVWIESESS